MSAAFLERKAAPKLAYQLQNGNAAASPTVVFLTGFRSDMTGTKAEFLSGFCQRRRQNFIRFDYRGHGQSDGVFEEGTIGLWLEDALDIIDTLSTGRILLIGSSMGGWIALQAALARPDRIKGLIGLAAAPDFTREIEERLSPQNKEDLVKHGRFKVISEWSPPYSLTQDFIDDGNARCLLDGPIALTIPVRLIQGMKDTEVPWQTAHRINNALTTDDKKVYLVEEGDHRLSRPQDLELLARQVDEVSAKISGAYI